MAERTLRENPIARPAELARLLMTQYAPPGGTAVDATVGNGNDTLTLARLVRPDTAGDRPTGMVYGFDIQEAALAAAGDRLRREGADWVKLICAGHETMAEQVPGPVDVVVFNLGYLPGGDKEVTTKAETTERAVLSALSLLRPGGAVILTVYGGHPAGAEERDRLLRLCRELPREQYHVLHAALLNQGGGGRPPEVLAIVSRRTGGGFHPGADACSRLIKK